MHLFGREPKHLSDEDTIRHALKVLGLGDSEGAEIAGEAMEALDRVTAGRGAVSADRAEIKIQNAWAHDMIRERDAVIARVEQLEAENAELVDLLRVFRGRRVVTADAINRAEEIIDARK